MKRTHIIFLLAGFAALLNSCSKSFITKNPADAVNTSVALTSASDLTAALNGVYSALRAVPLYGRDLPVIGDLQADNTFLESKNSGRYIAQYKYNVTLTDAVVSEIWGGILNNPPPPTPGAYTAILRANQIIDANVTGGNVASIKATAYALRALLYFKLVNIYARPYTADTGTLGVPIVLHYNPYDLPKRSSVGEVYNQIISDFQAGFANGQAYTSSIYLSKYAIEGMLAKAYLYMNRIQDAKAAAADVINNGPFSLVSPANYKAYWADPAPRTDAVETLLEIDANVISNNGYDDLGGIYINGYQDIYASSQLVALYSSSDVRTSVLITGQTKNGIAATLVNKYSNAQNSDRDNPKVMRLAEVYLIAAEASARSGDEAGALTYLNALMAQRDPAKIYSSTGDQLINDIVTERRKELAFEGDRLYDLNRLMLPIVRVNNPGSIPTSVLTIPFSDPRRIAPIPQDEIQANPNLADEQNPGY